MKTCDTSNCWYSQQNKSKNSRCVSHQWHHSRMLNAVTDLQIKNGRYNFRCYLQLTNPANRSPAKLDSPIRRNTRVTAAVSTSKLFAYSSKVDWNIEKAIKQVRTSRKGLNIMGFCKMTCYIYKNQQTTLHWSVSVWPRNQPEKTTCTFLDIQSYVNCPQT